MVNMGEPGLASRFGMHVTIFERDYAMEMARNRDLIAIIYRYWSPAVLP
jgi:hypothetical protein